MTRRPLDALFLALAADHLANLRHVPLVALLIRVELQAKRNSPGSLILPYADLREVGNVDLLALPRRDVLHVGIDADLE